jgi:predicted nicotinamide N-methyase
VFGNPQATVDHARLSGVLPTDLSQTDLVAGQYEGGFKLWEGGVDLAEYLAADVAGNKAVWGGKTVLELGCGHGLPGIIALLEGAEVHFQDFNKQVLQTLTVVNVAANWNAHRMQSVGAAVPNAAPARYFSGSWSALGPLLREQGLAGTYDVILTAETIYSMEALHSLYQCFKEVSALCYVYLHAQLYDGPPATEN